MSPSTTEDEVLARQSEWVLRVLGYGRANASNVEPKAAATAELDPVGIWWNAKDQVNEQIENLRHAFMATGHELASAACEAGLGSFSGGILVQFQAAVIEFNTASASERGTKAAEVRNLGEALKTFVSTSDMLPLLEANPFGVPVTIRTDMPSAIERITLRLEL